MDNLKNEKSGLVDKDQPTGGLKIKWWVWISTGLVLVIVVYSLTIAGLRRINQFFKINELEFPPVIQLNWPIKIKKRVKPISQKLSNVIVKKVVMVRPVVKVDPQIGRIVDFIWTEESGKGTASSGWHVRCRNKGMWNEIGWSGPNFCFKSKEEGLAMLQNEITARLAKNGLIETLCVYNLGSQKNEKGERIPYQNCMYYQKFLKS